MNTSDFTIKQSTVVSVIGTNAGTEIWVRHDNDVESSYLVTDDSFRAREGHRLTAIHFGRYAIALRNDTCMMKIQLLSGQDLLGSGPIVESRSAAFWFVWAFILLCPGFIVAGIPAEVLGSFHNVLLTYLGNILSVACYLAYVFGVPYWYIARPRLLRRKHQQRVKAANAAIAQLFNPL
jgi:hypothetical protein